MVVRVSFHLNMDLSVCVLKPLVRIIKTWSVYLIKKKKKERADAFT